MNVFEIFQYGFMLRAIAAGTIVGVVAPVVGLYLVTRRYAFMAETLGHVSLAGVALGAILGIPLLLSALVTSLVAALGVDRLRAARRVNGDALLALFLSGGLAISSILLSSGRAGISIQGLLFGSIATVSRGDLIAVASLGFLVIVAVVVLYRPLFASTLDEELARASGVAVGIANTALVTLAAVTVAVAIPLIGGLLVGALMVIPVATALQWKIGFLRTMLLSVAFSVASVIGGIVASFGLGFPSGGTIVLTAIVLFLLNAVAARKR